jgi:hypothetical protein
MEGGADGACKRGSGRPGAPTKPSAKAVLHDIEYASAALPVKSSARKLCRMFVQIDVGLGAWGTAPYPAPSDKPLFFLALFNFLVLARFLH